MATALMEKDGTYGAVETGKKSDASRPESVSLVKLGKSGANSSGAIEMFSKTALFSSKSSYASSSWCNKAELSTELEPCQELAVSFMKQQLRRSAEVLLRALAIPSELIPATFPRKRCATAAVPRVTESRRERRHPAGRQCRPHESRASRRAGSQG
ncbi:hypothetical protein N7414_18590 [Pseudomonas sp. GD04087]|uniref:hypothetical protein n=1 Tax=unclassified Pseudomonas TaxID=196821 RepID=UPI00244CCFC4|nr:MULTISPECIES: hypothetical protein [unclassified Pseudomonas]MDH0291137.1 hypothetical protein [Pseudomonas sp. GD04087]MDH1046995.1 hypothetical protein [Pseudomonas sp. GD03903]MDH1998255.1 hypothetical protein [Pseudomonas sp. GD03691]